jgi:hypothetical protein
MTTCEHCGQEARSTDLFCRFCGHALPALTHGSDQSGTAESSRYGANGVNGDSSQPRARLIVRPQNGNALADAREYALDGSDIIIGRSQACEIQLDGDQLLSRRHAQIHWDGQNFTITDLGSSNGTVVNDQEINVTVPLHDGDLVTVGEYELVFSARPAGPDAIIPRRGSGASPSSTRPTSTTLSEMTSTPMASTQVSPATLDHAATGADYTPDDARPVATPYEEPLTPWHADPSQTLTQAPPAHAQATSSYLDDDDMDLEQTATNLEAISAQLGQASTLLKKLGEEQRLSEQRRQALAEVRDEINSLLAAPPATTASGGADPQADTLAEVARQAAEHPKQIDSLMQLANHATEIADALQRQRAQAAGDDAATVRAQLEAIRAKLDHLV